jgi:hypothetical protein
VAAEAIGAAQIAAPTTAAPNMVARLANSILMVSSFIVVDCLQ